MQVARLALQMSQKDLALKVNEKQSVLQEIESGRATANPQILGKIERQLGVRLRGTLPTLTIVGALTDGFLQVTRLERNWKGPGVPLLKGVIPLM
jgi:transcriptional regulator with XRE-family HTH domain